MVLSDEWYGDKIPALASFPSTHLNGNDPFKTATFQEL